LRSALRQDPDVILIGEMRDSETAQIGLRAAVTGHMVLSTLHTRDAATTPLRLADMDVPRFMLAYSLQAVVAQRLIRVNCESCVEPYEPEGRELSWLKGIGRDPEGGKLMHGRGCQNCNGSGFIGRTGLYEMLEFDLELANLANNADPRLFVDRANKRMKGKTLRDRAADLVLAGRTTVGEAMRVVSSFED